MAEVQRLPAQPSAQPHARGETSSVPSPAPGAVAALTGPIGPMAALKLQRAAGNRAARAVLARQPHRTPAAAPPALPNTLIGALAQAQRLALRELTDEVAAIPLASLAPPPAPPGGHPAPGGATVSVTPAPEIGFTPATPDVTRALNAVVSHLAGGSSGVLQDNTTSAVFLDLRPYGGDAGVYRFTHVSAGGNTRYLVDFISAVPTAAPALLAITPASGFSQHRFAFLDPRGALSGSAAQQADEQTFRQAVAAAVQQIPDAFLGLVEGLSFRRQARHATDPDAGGDYSHASHVVTIYDRAMPPTVARFEDPGGAAAVNNLVRAVIHEIGHAIDETRLRVASQRLAAARHNLDLNFGAYGTRTADGGVDYNNIPQDQMRTFNSMLGAATAADRAYTNARAETGSGLDALDVPGAHTRFTRALTLAGPAELTPYAGSARARGAFAVESFAEAFSLFITEPDTLRALRPSLFAYFTDLQAHPERAR